MYNRIQRVSQCSRARNLLLKSTKVGSIILFCKNGKECLSSQDAVLRTRILVDSRSDSSAYSEYRVQKGQKAREERPHRSSKTTSLYFCGQADSYYHIITRCNEGEIRRRIVSRCIAYETSRARCVHVYKVIPIILFISRAHRCAALNTPGLDATVLPPAVKQT